MHWFRFSRLTISGFLAGSALVSLAQAPVPATPSAKPALAAASVPGNSRARAGGYDPHAREFYRLIWGVDALGVKSVESGEMIRFSYTVLDPTKAAQLNDKKAEPALIDGMRGVSLVVPSLEKVGQMRQSGTPEAGKAYWMVFSNKGVVVKPGDHVSVVIGKFHVDGLIVQ